jgi:hypothetical protein
MGSSPTAYATSNGKVQALKLRIADMEGDRKMPLALFCELCAEFSRNVWPALLKIALLTGLLLSGNDNRYKNVTGRVT